MTEYDDRVLGEEPLRFRGNSASLKAARAPGEHPLHSEVVLSFPPGLQLMTDASSARWVEEALLSRRFASVGALVPDGFEAYARVLHPAYIGRHPNGERVTWATVASWTGRVVHPLMQFARIAELGDDPNTQPDWGTRPEDGSLPDDVVAPLVPVSTRRRLAAELATPGKSWPLRIAPERGSPRRLKSSASRTDRAGARSAAGPSSTRG